MIYVTKNFDQTGEIQEDTTDDPLTKGVVHGAKYGVLFSGEWFASREDARAFLLEKYTKERRRAEARIAKLDGFISRLKT